MKIQVNLGSILPKHQALFRRTHDSRCPLFGSLGERLSCLKHQKATHRHSLAAADYDGNIFTDVYSNGFMRTLISTGLAVNGAVVAKPSTPHAA